MVQKMTMKFYIIILISMVLLFNGCTVIGTVVGHVSDRSQPDKVPVAAYNIDELALGRKISVYTKDGAVSTGRYKGIETMNGHVYSALYDSSRQKLKDRVWLPTLGEEIQLKLAGVDVLFRRQFTGFEHHRVLVQKLDTDEGGMALIDRVEYIEDNKGNSLTGNTLKVLMTEGAVAYSSNILLKVDMTVTQIPMDEVDHVEVKNRKSGIFIALIGLAVDTLLYISLRNNMISVNLGWGY